MDCVTGLVEMGCSSRQQIVRDLNRARASLMTPTVRADGRRIRGSTPHFFQTTSTTPITSSEVSLEPYEVKVICVVKIHAIALHGSPQGKV